MKNQIAISIKNPCSEDWRGFQPTAKGGFCDACQKEVIDFTKYSVRELIDYFKSGTGNTCGNLRNDQLGKLSSPELVTSKVRNAWLRWSAAAGLAIAGMDAAYAQVSHQLEISSVTKIKNTAAERIITGNVMDETGEAFPGVSVVIKGTTTGTTTDLKGNYSIAVPGESSILVFSSVGLENQEILVQDQTVINLKMELAMLGEIVVMAGLVSTELCYIEKPKRVTKILDFFRRKQ